MPRSQSEAGEMAQSAVFAMHAELSSDPLASCKKSHVTGSTHLYISTVEVKTGGSLGFADLERKGDRESQLQRWPQILPCGRASYLVSVSEC